MKKILSILMVVVMVCLTCVISMADEGKATGAVIFVAPNGNDSNDGSESSPLATLNGARDKVRTIKNAGFPQNGITVMFRGGEYYWKETVDFTAEDSGTEQGKIRYCAYPGETPIFTGGVRIPASEFSAVSDENILVKWTNRKAKENIKQFDIKSYLARLGYTDLYDYYPLKNERYGQGADEYLERPVYSLGDSPALWLARYPNKSGGWYEENPHTQFITTGNVIKETNKTNGDKEGSVFQYNDRKISKYAGRSDVWFYGFPKWLFYHEEMRIADINSTNSTITTAVAPSIGISAGREFILFNILEELDAPGEYYIDKETGIFYVYPNAELDYLNVGCFKNKYMITATNASNLVFSGISFENTKGNGVYIKGGENCRIEYCDFKNISGNGVIIGDGSEVTYTQFFDYKWKDWFEGQTEAQGALTQYNYWMQDKCGTALRGKNHGIYGCHIKNTGLTGVILTGGNVYRNEEAGYYIENCDISYSAVNKRTYEGCVRADNCYGITIKNNTFSHFPSTGISGYIYKGIIDGNEIYDGLMESYDMGLIYINYCCPGLDLKITNNYLHDVPPEAPITSPTSPLSQRSGIAFDNDYAAGADITNNVFENIPRVMFLNDMENISNNVFVDCYEPAYTKNTTTHNYPAQNKKNVFNAKETFHPGYWTYTLTWPIFIEGETGEKVKADWRERFPRIMQWVDIMQAQTHEGKNFFKIKDNLIVNQKGFLLGNHLKFDSLELAKVPYSENSNNTYTSDTSCFADYANENYQLTVEGAAKYKINPIDMSKIGNSTDKTGIELYKTVCTSVPKVSGGTTQVATSDVSVPEKIKTAVALKIGSSNAFAKGKAVKVDSNNLSVIPQIIDSRTLVPVRFIAENFGGEVGWDEATRTVLIKINGKVITMTLDNKSLIIDGKEVATMDVAAQSIEGRTMVPLRALCEKALNKNVFWDAKGLIVISDEKELLNSQTDASLIEEILNKL